MKLGEKLYGFTVKKATEIAEIGATLYEMEYEKCGATLLYLDREDDNKTFSVAFKTIPEDSTGVFHIIEHSVLCGSKKYPVKEPFVELLKSSLQTFLNAMTYPDKTVYPLSSRNNKDFFNIMDIYLDAVFHPAILENENIFRQEGWHYEYNPETNEITTSGVVLNEMRGAFSDPEEIGFYHLREMLYPDNCYRFESGGEPSHVCDLTYEQFKNSHAKYYHPSNAILFLDGSVEIEKALTLISSYLEEYDKIDIDFDVYEQPKISPVSREVNYEIAPTESAENKTHVGIGYLTTRFDEQEKTLAQAVIIDAIASSNESPLKKAVLASGLCEDFSVLPVDSMKQNALILQFRNIKDGRCDDLISLVDKTLGELKENGIDKVLLESSLNILEFKMREKDYGTYPTGIVFALSILETALYGGDASQNLSYSDSFASLREKLCGRYFEELLSELIIDNTHKATVIMHPDATLGQKRADEQKAEMAAFRDSLSKNGLEEIIKADEKLKEWQKTPETPEQLASIPLLSVSDVSPEAKYIEKEVIDEDGVCVLLHNMKTAGIIYGEIYFDVSDVNEKELYEINIFNSLITNVRTEKYTALELQSRIKLALGSFGLSLKPTNRDGEVKIYLVVSFSALESKKDEALALVREIIYNSDFSDLDVLKNIAKQKKISEEESATSAGHVTGLGRASAAVSAEAAVSEYYSGYEAHLKTKRLVEDFDTLAPELISNTAKINERFFTKERALVSLVGNVNKDIARDVVNLIKSGEKVLPVCNIKPLGQRREGVVIPAQVGFAQTACNIHDIGQKCVGSLHVARMLISYGYLWNAVRVQGGAYGTGLIVRNSGCVGFYSYRDPSPLRSVGCYKEATSFLREYAKSGEDITKFIIGTIGDAEPLTPPRLLGSLSAMRYLRNISYEDVCKTRREILETDSDELIRIADMLDKAFENEALCIVAGKNKLDECEKIIDSTLVM